MIFKVMVYQRSILHMCIRNDSISHSAAMMLGGTVNCIMRVLFMVYRVTDIRRHHHHQ
jgi:hypothetical protein